MKILLTRVPAGLKHVLKITDLLTGVPICENSGWCQEGHHKVLLFTRLGATDNSGMLTLLIELLELVVVLDWRCHCSCKRRKKAQRPFR